MRPVYRDADIICIGDISILHIDFHNSETGAQIGIDTIDVQAVDGLVICIYLCVIVGDIECRAVFLKQVDVLVWINNSLDLVYDTNCKFNDFILIQLIFFKYFFSFLVFLDMLTSQQLQNYFHRHK